MMNGDDENEVFADDQPNIGGHRDSDVSSSNVSRNSASTDNEIRATLRERSKHSLIAKNSVNEDLENNKITGYLEKRSKMFGWRTFWFVLDERLLTYYKSKSEYESLCAFNGSINLGIATNVSPIKATKGFPFQIVTRTQVYYLRAQEKPQLDLWLVAIQEAATIPPNISNPIWVDPGIQFNRYSFTSASHWSLSASTDDLTNAHTIHSHPQNFSKTSTLLKKCHSFAALNFIGGKSSNTHTTQFKNKSGYYNNYYSSNNNNSSTTNLYNSKNELASSNTNTNTNTNKNIKRSSAPIPNLGPDPDLEATPNNLNSDGEKQEKKASGKYHNVNVNGLKKKSGLHKMRHTASMMTLDSSPQAGELKRELVRKLSIPMSMSNSNSNSNSQTQKSGDRTSGNTYSNYQPPDVHHDYDEIMDLDKGIYEPCGVNVGQKDVDDTGRSDNSDKPEKRPESIYENVENPSVKNPNPTPNSRQDDPWEKLPTTNSNSNGPSRSSSLQMLVDGPLPSHQQQPYTGHRNVQRRSLQQRESTGRNSLLSIAEIPEKENISSSSSSLPYRQSQGDSFGSSLTLPPHMSSSSLSQFSWDKSSEKDSDTNSTSSSGNNKKKKKTKSSSKKAGSSISGFFHKIFNKDKKKKDGRGSGGGEDVENTSTRDLDITGPVDLRKLRHLDNISQALSSQSQSPRQRQLSPTSSSTLPPNSRINIYNSGTGIPSVGSNLNQSKSDNLLAELNKKIGQMKRSSSSGEQIQSQSQSQNQNQNQTQNVNTRDRFSLRKSRSHSEPIVEEEIGFGELGMGNHHLITRSHPAAGDSNSNHSNHSNRSSCMSYSGGSLSRSRSGSGSGSGSGFGSHRGSSISESGSLRGQELHCTSASASTHTLQAYHNTQHELEQEYFNTKRIESESEEFQKKLARFNRLSASLTPSFVAALSHSVSYTSNVLHPSSSLNLSDHAFINGNSSHSHNYHFNNNPSNSHRVSRSQSWRIRCSDEPPLLPPKRKQCFEYPVYDVPQNNTPVPTQACMSSGKSTGDNFTTDNLRQALQIQIQLPISRNHALTKKNSAPDVSFQRPKTDFISSSSQNHKSLLMKSLFEPTDDILQSQSQSQCQNDGKKEASICKSSDGQSESNGDLKSESSSSLNKQSPPTPPPRPPKKRNLSTPSNSIPSKPTIPLPPPVLVEPSESEKKEDNETTETSENVVVPLPSSSASSLLCPMETVDKGYVNWILPREKEKKEDEIKNDTNNTSEILVSKSEEKAGDSRENQPVEETEAKEKDLEKERVKSEESCEESNNIEIKVSELENVQDSNSTFETGDEMVKVEEETAKNETLCELNETVETIEKSEKVSELKEIEIENTEDSKINLINFNEPAKEQEQDDQKIEIESEQISSVENETEAHQPEPEPEIHEEKQVLVLIPVVDDDPVPMKTCQNEDANANENENENVESEDSTEDDDSISLSSSLIQVCEILESPMTTTIATPMEQEIVHEQDKSKFMKMFEAPARHQVEILEIPPLISLQPTTTTKPKVRVKPHKLQTRVQSPVKEKPQPDPQSSPTLSAKSVDIDNLEILSDLSDTASSLPGSPIYVGPNPPDVLDKERIQPSSSSSPGLLPEPAQIQKMVENQEKSRVSLAEASTNFIPENNKSALLINLDDLDDKFDDGSHFYDDVPFEDVTSEQEDSKFKLQFATYHESVPWETVIEETEEEVYEMYDDFPAAENLKATASIVRSCSVEGQTAEQILVPLESIQKSGIDQLKTYLSENNETDCESFKTRGTINRLGHSSAIAELKQLLENDNNIS